MPCVYKFVGSKAENMLENPDYTEHNPSILNTVSHAYMIVVVIVVKFMLSIGCRGIYKQ